LLFQLHIFQISPLRKAVIVACNTFKKFQTEKNHMILCFLGWTSGDVSDTISIATPIILLFWFYYSQRQTLSKSYFDQVDGIYAGFTEPISKLDDTKGLHSGIIMNIRDTDDKGYFKGEFDFGETKTEIENNSLLFRSIIDGVHTFLGKLDFKIYRDRIRHPFRPEENRIYKGTLYIVDRLDFAFEDYNIDTYLRAEYDILHYREMQTMKFTLRKRHKNGEPELPETFVLHKKMGVSFEPYQNVKEVVFRGETRSDA
jgi:hypothetical protein